MSGIFFGTSGSWLLFVAQNLFWACCLADHLLLDLDAAALEALRTPGAGFPMREPHVTDALHVCVREDVGDQLLCTQESADLEIGLVHDDFFLERLLDDDRRERVPLELDPRLLDFLAVDRVEPRFEPRFVCLLRLFPELRRVAPPPPCAPLAPDCASPGCWTP
jgi:hypothetical protein